MPGTTPRISVLLPVYNGENYVRECIASVLAQTMRDFELLIGDDCSSDQTAAIVASFADDRIRFIPSERRLGQFANLNRLPKLARSQWLRFINHDDLMEPNCLEQELAFFERHPEVGLAFCKYTMIDPGGQQIDACALNDMPDVVSAARSVQMFFYYGCIPGTQSAVTMRRDVWEKSGEFDTTLRIAGDYDMYARASVHAPLGVIHQHLMKIRIHPNQISVGHGAGLAFIKEGRQIRSFLMSKMPDELKSYARLYDHQRQGVLDVHYGLRCLMGGHVGLFAEVVRAMGLSKFLMGFLFWVLTVDNRLFRPTPRFIDSPAASPR